MSKKKIKFPSDEFLSNFIYEELSAYFNENFDSDDHIDVRNALSNLIKDILKLIDE